MTETGLIEQINKVCDILLGSSERIIMAQTEGDNIRVNVGNSILVFDRSILHFKSRYTMLSTSLMELNKKLLSEVVVMMRIYLVSVVPKSWGYRFNIYNGTKKIKVIDIKLYVTNSPIICYLYLIRQFLSFKPRSNTKTDQPKA